MAVTRLREGRPPLIVATGGDDVYDNQQGRIVYKVHKFLTSDDFIVTAGAGNVEYLIVAGGGGSGGNNAIQGGGSGSGGAGGLLFGTVAVTVQTYAVTVGAGGAGSPSSITRGVQGGDSSVFSLTAIGGGGGGAQTGETSATSGGSGGGVTADVQAGAGTAGQGFHGSGGTGGGAGGGAQMNIGGRPLYLDIDGRMRPYAAAGRAGFNRGNVTVTERIETHEANTGNGGRGLLGGNNSRNGIAGTSGVVIIRYPVRYI
jgi:hypothetical protein